MSLLHHGHHHVGHSAGAHGGADAEPHRLGRLDERRRVLVVVGLTATILVAEVVGGLLSGSRALLADAGHMLSDLAAQIVSLAALAIAARPADVRRTYGYHRVEILAALGNGVALLALAAWLLFSATQRLRHGGGEIHTGLMIAVAAVGLVANLIGAWVLSGARSLNVRAAYLHLLLDTLSSLAVVIGGTVMALVSGLYVLDSILALAIGLFVILGAWRLCRDAVDVLLEAVPAGMESDGVARAMGRCGGVREVHDLHIWTITSGLLALSAHVVVDSGDVHRNDDLLKELKELLLRDYRIAHTTIQIESHEYEHVGDTCGAEGAR